jgi:hypothetical protein
VTSFYRGRPVPPSPIYHLRSSISHFRRQTTDNRTAGRGREQSDSVVNTEPASARSHVCSSANHVDHKLGLREHRHMAARDFVDAGFHPLRNKTFQLRVHSAVVLAHDVPARLRSPRGSFKLMVEEVHVWHALSRPNEFLFLLWQVSRETRNATWLVRVVY